ncbi:MAG: DoxX family protein [Acidobacteria bacterium]|uniref:DoxX family protein n=1 Tax=Candidatus Polarisedimenticola svalbardensis TaxID=2886004 RepID=A0A8J6XWX8_9BACT|nr:DoxX family protein [Candidatus Polarisedimenticola svalbardensis]
MNRDKAIYWAATGLLSVMMLGSAGMYLFNNGQVTELFLALGYPAYLVIPLAILKILGVIAILSKQSKILKDLAYAGFMYDFLLAASAHINAGDGEFIPALAALFLLGASFFYDRKLHA